MKTKKAITGWRFAVLLSTLTLFSFTGSTEFYKTLQKYCETLPGEFDQISAERKKDLEEIGDFVIEKRVAKQSCKLLFICTSNLRRSHLAQVWAYSASVYYGIDSVLTFSGGTEATRVHPNAIAAMRRCGFNVTTTQGGDNPTYFVTAGTSLGQWAIFSKKYGHSFNPKSNFCAAMVCSEADKSCPNVEGAELRVGLAYDDPKYYDGTPSQDQKYDERCRQIAREMFYTMDYVKKKLILKVESKQ